MSDEQAIAVAENCLRNRQIEFVLPATVEALPGDLITVTFLVPEALDSNAVVDPPGVRVIIDGSTSRAELLVQM